MSSLVSLAMRSMAVTSFFQSVPLINELTNISARPSLLSMFCSSPSLKLLMFASSIFSSNSPARSFLISLSSKSFTSSSVCPCLGSPPNSNAE